MDKPVPHVRDDLYYLKSVIFLVEDNLFKVPKQYFQKNSRIFSNIFSDDHTAEGSSDEKPILLYSIQKVDFERLLAVMYPICGLGPATLGRSEWESTLKLSTLWELRDLRTLAIQNLSKIEMREVDQITLGMEYRVADWLVKGYTKLAQRDNTISEDEGDILGL
ncbi:hypothetical protein PILCRDRAFT_830429 [Piloderma croceum F 1598]|uniref:BTB domain-containing protein n=1 Tax=Piloderma croceum (strain F 1598) TaxID=765440 RepID=A0A0C3B242_PILCF|nr:hypothetical protein PILCRDRAFT_830429 [Piloderma croceum F 1598]